MCWNFCDPMDFPRQEWVAISSSRGSSQPGDGTQASCASCTGFFTTEPPGKPTLGSIFLNHSISHHNFVCWPLLLYPLSADRDEEAQPKASGRGARTLTQGAPLWSHLLSFQLNLTSKLAPLMELGGNSVTHNAMYPEQILSLPLLAHYFKYFKGEGGPVLQGHSNKSA